MVKTKTNNPYEFKCNFCGELHKKRQSWTALETKEDLMKAVHHSKHMVTLGIVIQQLIEANEDFKNMNLTVTITKDDVIIWASSHDFLHLDYLEKGIQADMAKKREEKIEEAKQVIKKDKGV